MISYNIFINGFIFNAPQYVTISYILLCYIRLDLKNCIISYNIFIYNIVSNIGIL